jgi:hypothetical protein
VQVGRGAGVAHPDCGVFIVVEETVGGCLSLCSCWLLGQVIERGCGLTAVGRGLDPETRWVVVVVVMVPFVGVKGGVFLTVGYCGHSG